MRGKAIRPRPDQIDVLTRGLSLPLPEISEIHLEVIAEGVFQTFKDIRAQSPTTVAGGSEAEVTALLETRLNQRIEQDPFWRQLVICVVRGKESLSFDGSHLEKRPDLAIYLSDRNRGFPLIAEAKIIDAVAAKTEVLYCNNGIERFVDGEYAWGNREALMLAYVRDGSSIGSKLTPFLMLAKAKAPPGYLVTELPMAVGSGAGDMARSRHARRFTYPSRMPPSHAPGPISLWHLWLS